MNVQRIHVGAQRDGALAAGVALQRADDAGSGEAAMDLDAELLQPLRDEFRRPMLFEGGLRMGMNIVAPGDEIGVEIGDPVDDGHGVYPRCNSVLGLRAARSEGGCRRDSCKANADDRLSAAPAV